MRSVIFRYGDNVALCGALSETQGSLPLPEGEAVHDGEWVLAIFEIGSRRRATAAAARAVCAAGDTHLEFERRDWERLIGFVTARSEHARASRPASARGSEPASVDLRAPPPSVRAFAEAPRAQASEAPRSRRFDDLPASTPLESSRVPFGARVLVVHDTRTGDELRVMLAEMGLVVDLVATTTGAEERIEAEAFDAIVLDMHAAGGDSRGFVVKLRADVRFSDVPVLFLSNQPTSRDVVDAFASGGDDFLPKPFRTPELAARIFGLLRRARITRGDVGGAGR